MAVGVDSHAVSAVTTSRMGDDLDEADNSDEAAEQDHLLGAGDEGLPGPDWGDAARTAAMKGGVPPGSTGDASTTCPTGSVSAAGSSSTLPGPKVAEASGPPPFPWGRWRRPGLQPAGAEGGGDPRPASTPYGLKHAPSNAQGGATELRPRGFAHVCQVRGCFVKHPVGSCPNERWDVRAAGPSGTATPWYQAPQAVGWPATSASGAAATASSPVAAPAAPTAGLADATSVAAPLGTALGTGSSVDPTVEDEEAQW